MWWTESWPPCQIYTILRPLSRIYLFKFLFLSCRSRAWSFFTILDFSWRQHCFRADWRCKRIINIWPCRQNNQEVEMYLNSRWYFSYVIPYVLLSSSFKRYLCTYNAHKDTSLILLLINFVAAPTKTQEGKRYRRDPTSDANGVLTKLKTYLILFTAVLVMTSAPCSKRSGILFANLKIFRPCTKQRWAT